MRVLRHGVLRPLLLAVRAGPVGGTVLHEQRVQARLRPRLPGHAHAQDLAAHQVQGAPRARAAGARDGHAAGHAGGAAELQVRTGPARAAGAGRAASSGAAARADRPEPRHRAHAPRAGRAGRQHVHAAVGRPARRLGRRGAGATPVHPRLPRRRLPRLPVQRLEVRHLRRLGVQGLRRAQAGRPARRAARVQPRRGGQLRHAAARQPALPAVRRHDIQAQRLRPGQSGEEGRGACVVGSRVRFFVTGCRPGSLLSSCAQMFCTQCHVAFSWRTGAVVTGGVIHK